MPNKPAADFVNRYCDYGGEHFNMMIDILLQIDKRYI